MEGLFCKSLTKKEGLNSFVVGGQDPPRGTIGFLEVRFLRFLKFIYNELAEMFYNNNNIISNIGYYIISHKESY
jgi:hypothetical protein